MAKIRKYSDIDLNFTAHPVTGDLVMVVDSDSVKQSVKTLVLTKFYERAFHPERGSPIYGLMFENMNVFTASLIAKSIRIIITDSEPRAELINIKVSENMDNNEYECEIIFRVINTLEPIILNVILTRV